MNLAVRKPSGVEILFKLSAVKADILKNCIGELSFRGQGLIINFVELFTFLLFLSYVGEYCKVS